MYRSNLISVAWLALNTIDLPGDISSTGIAPGSVRFPSNRERTRHPRVTPRATRQTLARRYSVTLQFLSRQLPRSQVSLGLAPFNNTLGKLAPRGGRLAASWTHKQEPPHLVESGLTFVEIRPYPRTFPCSTGPAMPTRCKTEFFMRNY